MNATIDYQNHILTYLQERFGTELLAVVLFGSRVHHTAKAFSDIDLLVILNGLPKEPRKRRQLAAIIRREVAFPTDVTLLSPPTFIDSVRYCAPLMIELACAHEIWFEKTSFFSSHIQFLRALMQEGKLIPLQSGVWKLAENVDEMATDGIGVLA